MKTVKQKPIPTRCMLPVKYDLHYRLKIYALLKGKKMHEITHQALNEYLERDNAQ
jgi:hypothetical protein